MVLPSFMIAENQRFRAVRPVAENRRRLDYRNLPDDAAVYCMLKARER